MKYHEQIYTSAPKLLVPTSGHLGVVAQTEQFPKELESRCAMHRAYTSMEHAESDNGPPPPKFLVDPPEGGAGYTILTRVAPVAADHTGRSNLLAHHLAIDASLLSQPSRPRLLAELATRFRSEWTEPPTWIVPPPTLPESDSKRLFTSPLSEHLELLFNTADASFRFLESGRPVVLCIPQSYAGDAFAIFSDVQQLLPYRLRQSLRCQSHLVGQDDMQQGAAIGITYPGTAFERHCRIRQDPARPIVLTLEPQTSEYEASEYAAHLRRYWGDQDNNKLSQFFCDVDRLEVDSKSVSSVLDFQEFRTDLHNNQFSVTSLSNNFNDHKHGARYHQEAEREAESFAGGLLDAATPDAWEKLLEIFSEPAWPVAIKDRIRNELLECRNLTKLAAQPPVWKYLTKNKQVRTIVRSRLSESELLLESAIEGADQDPACERAVRFLLQVADANLENAARWHQVIESRCERTRGKLLKPIQEYLCKNANTCEAVKFLVDKSQERPSAQGLLIRDVCLPLLRRWTLEGNAWDERSKPTLLRVRLALQIAAVETELSLLLSESNGGLPAEFMTFLLEAYEGQPEYVDLKEAMQKVASETYEIADAPMPPPLPEELSDDDDVYRITDDNPEKEPAERSRSAQKRPKIGPIALPSTISVIVALLAFARLIVWLKSSRSVGPLILPLCGIALTAAWWVAHCLSGQIPRRYFPVVRIGRWAATVILILIFGLLVASLAPTGATSPIFLP